MSTDAPTATRETVRVLKSPSVDWAEAKRHDPTRKEEAKPYTGTMLDIDIVDGIARVPEGRKYTTRRADGGSASEPLWHVFVRDLRFVDVTDEQAPEVGPPAYPLNLHKPHRGEERNRVKRMLGTRFSMHTPDILLEQEDVLRDDLVAPIAPRK
jgi:hypothetical protein